MNYCNDKRRKYIEIKIDNEQKSKYRTIKMLKQRKN